MTSYIYDGILGLVLGDVLGHPFEGKTRKNMNRLFINSFDDLIKYDEENKWIYTDDTSLTLASMDSLIGGYDLRDMMEKFSSWLYQGKYSSSGHAIGIGRSTKSSIKRFNDGFPPEYSGGIKDSDNGNGSLMRILPLVFYLYSQKEILNMDEIIEKVEELSSLTHQHFKSKIACGIYTFLVFRILDDRLNNRSFGLNELIDKGLEDSFSYYSKKDKMKNSFSIYERIYDRDFKDLSLNHINSSAYVLDTLESLLYTLYNTRSFKESIWYAIMLGGDTDSQAGLVGSISGIYYGIDNLLEYIEKIENINQVNNIIDGFTKKYGRK